MPHYQRFEDLPAWQEAARLYNSVLDLLEKSKTPLSAGFRSQLDRAALSVSNNIAEGFERVSTAELLNFIAIARGSAGEVRSMTAVAASRPQWRPIERDLACIGSLAESCARQLTAWTRAIESSPVQGKRHRTPEWLERKKAADKAIEFRRSFLRGLNSDHPLYHSTEARAARGEITADD